MSGFAPVPARSAPTAPTGGRRHSRVSLSHALSRIVHATEDLVDDTLDRAGDFEHDVRRSLSRALDDERRGDDHGHVGPDAGGAAQGEPAAAGHRGPDPLEALREQVGALAERLEQYLTGASAGAAAPPGLQAAAVPAPRGPEDFGALKNDLAELSRRLDQISGIEN